MQYHGDLSSLVACHVVRVDQPRSCSAYALAMAGILRLNQKGELMSKVKAALRLGWIGMGLAVAGLHAQTSQISGQVTDQSKQAIDHARITVTRSDTGDRREIV